MMGVGEAVKLNEEDTKDKAVPAYNPSTWEAEVGGWRIQGQPGLHNKTVR
jgi:hypothetical protein